jgi:hypothetical protein
MRVSLSPAEADPPLVIDPNAVLAGSLTGEAFQTVARGHAKLLEPLRCVQKQELAVRASLHVRWEPTATLAFEHLSGRGVSEGPNHWASVTLLISNVNRYYRTRSPTRRCS